MSDGDFWEDALDMLLFNVLDLCYWAYDDKISVEKIFAAVNFLPRTEKEFKDDYQRLAQNKKTANREKRQPSSSAFFRAFERLDKLVSHQMLLDKQRHEKQHGQDSHGSQYVKLKA